MEIQFLLRDFEADPNGIDDWLTASEQDRLKRFRPFILRQRQAARLGIKPEDAGEARDYKAHSGALHVMPHPMPLGGKGFAPDKDTFGRDMCFWEMFEHGRRLIWQMYRLKHRVAPRMKGVASPQRGMKAFRDGWRLTQEMQSVFIALLQASKDEDESNRI
ncbi:MAG: hypothetical protein ACREQH_01420 [Candidatus Binatus sp.]